MFMLVPLFPSVYLPNLLFYILIWYACTVYTSFNNQLDLFRVDAAFSWYRTKSTRMITKNKLFVSNTFCIVNISLFLESSPYVGRIYTYIYIYTVFYVHTDFQFTIETHSYTCDDSNIVFNRLFYLYLGPNAKDMISLLIEFVYETRDLVDGLPPRAGGYVCFSLDMMVVSSTQEYLSIGWKLHHWRSGISKITGR